MPSSEGVREQLLGQDLLTQHNMKPWWETIHGYMLATTLTFSFLMIYVITPGPQVNCMPTNFENGTESGSTFTESQTALVDGYCTSQIPWYAKYAGIINFVTGTVILIVSNVWLNHPIVIDAFKTFAKAERIINSLNSRAKSLKLMAISPVFTKEGEAFELRKACILLWTHRANIRWHYGLRNALVLSMTLITFCVTFAVAVLMGKLVLDPNFNCSLSTTHKAELELTLDGYSKFFCSYTTVKLIFPFQMICMVAFYGQLLSLIIAHIQLRPTPPTQREKAIMTTEFLRAKDYVYFMKVFWSNARPVDKKRFEDVVTYIFSSEAIDSMSRFIIKAVTNVKTLNEKLDLPPNFRGRQYRHVIPNPDPTFIELYAKIHRNGGNNVVAELHKFYQKRASDFSDEAILQALGKVKFSSWDKPTTDFAKLAFEKLEWRLFVNILNSYADKAADRFQLQKIDCGVYDFNLQKREDGEEKGKSILYFALSKEPGVQEFNWSAVKHILFCTKGRGEKFVYDAEKCIPAVEFIQSQYDDDPTFSEELKDDLIAMIKVSEFSGIQEGFSITTI